MCGISQALPATSNRTKLMLQYFSAFRRVFLFGKIDYYSPKTMELKIVINTVIASYFEHYEIAAAGYAPKTTAVLLECVRANWPAGIRAAYRPEFVTTATVLAAIANNARQFVDLFCNNIKINTPDCYLIINTMARTGWFNDWAKQNDCYNKAAVEGASFTGNVTLMRQIGLTNLYCTNWAVCNRQVEATKVLLQNGSSLQGTMIAATRVGLTEIVTELYDNYNFEPETIDYIFVQTAIRYDQIGVFAIHIKQGYGLWNVHVYQTFPLALRYNRLSFAIMIWNQNPNHRDWMAEQLQNHEFRWHFNLY